MDNPQNGGNKGNFGEGQNDFSWIEAENRDGRENVESKLGGTATTGVMDEILNEIDERKIDAADTDSESFDLPDMKPVAELKPLIADGTTERKLGKVGISLVGDKVDIEGVSAEVKRIKQMPLREQVNAVNETTAKEIYANFGWMIGNDDIGEIQAEEAARASQAGENKKGEAA